MTHRNTLMEWMEQTKRISKNIDYVCLDTIDSVIAVMPFMRHQILIKHQYFFDRLCKKYHKPNPMGISKRYFKMKLNCALAKCQFTDKMNIFVDASLMRCQKLTNDVEWQWFEIIDFMYERPELVNPTIIDQYVTDRIFEVCRNHKKNNPLKNGVSSRFGKFWKDERGNWHRERRKV